MQVVKQDGQEIAKFRPGTAGSTVFETLLTKIGEGSVKDSEGYEITKDSQNLPAGIYIFSPKVDLERARYDAAWQRLEQRVQDMEDAQHSFRSSIRQAHDVGADALTIEADLNGFAFLGGIDGNALASIVHEHGARWEAQRLACTCEEDFQVLMNEVLLFLVPDGQHHVDTHRCGLIGTGLKPDASILDVTSPAPRHLIKYGEWKHKMGPRSDHCVVSGQVLDRAQKLKPYQPHRSHWLAIAAGTDGVELWMVQVNWTVGASTRRSGLVDLNFNNVNSTGLKLMQLFASAVPQACHYAPPEGMNVTLWSEHILHMDAVLKIGRGGAEVYEITLQGQKYIFKIPLPSDFEQENANLEWVDAQQMGQFLVRKHAQSMTFDGRRFFVIGPYGRPLGFPEDPFITFRQFRGVVVIIQNLSQKDRIHGDLSYANILQDSDGRVFLTDVQSLRNPNQGGIITGTSFFLSTASMGPGAVQNVGTELDTAFNVMIFCLAKGSVVWRNFATSSQAHRFARTHLFQQNFHLILETLPAQAANPVSRMHQLLYPEGVHSPSSVTPEAMLAILDDILSS